MQEHGHRRMGACRPADLHGIQLWAQPCAQFALHRNPEEFAKSVALLLAPLSLRRLQVKGADAAPP